MRIKIPYFNDARVELIESIDQLDTEAVSALAAFLELTGADRVSDSRHVFAYFKDFREGVDGNDCLDGEIQISDNPAEIWEHVRPSSLFLEREEDGDRSWYVVIEAECAWEAEHGLMMVWRRGKVLNKVGSYDGHLTNAHAFDDDSLRDVIYVAANPEYMTHPTRTSGAP